MASRKSTQSGLRGLLAFALVFAVAFIPVVTVAEGECGLVDEGNRSAVVATPPAVSEVMFPDSGEMTVFAAASLVDAFAEIVTDIQDANPGITITVETAGSQTLVTQLQEGAQADVLATASTSTMSTAVEDGLIDGQAVVFTGNRLVVAVPTGNPASISSLVDLAMDGLKLVLAGAEVPVGAYTRSALCNYALSGGAPEGFLDAFEANVVSEELDVRGVLSKIQLGEADAGVVYASDAVAAGLNGNPVEVIEFPDSVNVTAVYPIAPVDGGDYELAAAFISHVLGAKGQATLEKFGFVYP